MLLIITALSPALALAHPGHDQGASFMAGLAHPLSGLDHVAAMLGIGLFASQYHRRILLFLIALAAGSVGIGGVIGHLAGEIPFVDQAIAASILTVGLLLFRTTHLSWSVGAVAVSAFSLFHGLAHGAEMPYSIATLPYAWGFLCSSLALLGIGASAAALSPARQRMCLNYGGCGLLACSIVLVLS